MPLYKVPFHKVMTPRWMLLGLVTLLVGGFLVVATEMMEARAGSSELIWELDQATLHSFAGFRSDGLTQAAINLTALGSGVVLTIIIGLLTIFLWMLRHRLLAIQIAASGLGSLILTHFLKPHFERPRPALVERLVIVDGYSFPSGHSLSSAAIYFTIGIIGWRLLEKPYHKVVFQTLCAGLALSIGLSRIYLGVHYFSDVTAGIMLGVAWASLLAAFIDHRAHSPNSPSV